MVDIIIDFCARWRREGKFGPRFRLAITVAKDAGKRLATRENTSSEKHRVRVIGNEEFITQEDFNIFFLFGWVNIRKASGPALNIQVQFR